ncbi:GNAT family N-acetyltransferase [Novosphingobium sp. 9]|uniref:GNAT family N-acetyltransferase n=1 Tax=Novosphingobium sp. 9 TaxID=2025349 RepID=UPI0021B62919|nr:GNAT family N-acetyltransferase [Novosphingobium sp. 9]
MLRTTRFDLYRPQPGDLDGLVELVAHPETQRFLGLVASDRKGQAERLMRNAGSWALYGYGTFMVRARGRDEIVAGCGVFHTFRGFAGMDDVPEAGWIVRHDHGGKGVATEVMAAVMDWFDATHGSRRITCMIEQGNLASDRVATRLGFTRRGEHRLDDGCLLWLYERTLNGIDDGRRII